MKTRVLGMMVRAYPRPIATGEFLQKYLYSFRNRLSEARIQNGINYNPELAKKSQYVFSSLEDLQKAREFLGANNPPREKPHPNPLLGGSKHPKKEKGEEGKKSRGKGKKKVKC